MGKDDDDKEDEFSLDDYDDTQDEGLDLPDIDDELGGFDDDDNDNDDDDNDNDDDDDNDKDKDDEKEEKKDESEDKEEEGKEEEGEKEEKAEVTAAPSPEEISREEISMPLTIEIGRLNLSLEKLLQLKEGNVLDLSVQPESGVDLVVNGQCIGKGELLKAGNSIAIRILDLA